MEIQFEDKLSVIAEIAEKIFEYYN